MEISIEQYNKMAERLTYLEYKEADKQWIPCSERLPEKTIESYLVTVKWNKEELETTDDTEVTVAEWIDARCYKGCENIEDLDGWGNLNGRIIAWMPLPEPYKEEGES